MCAKVSALSRVHHTLKHGAEDGRRYFAPVVVAAVEQCLPHLFVEACCGQVFFKQLSIYIRKLGKLLINIFKTLFFRSVQYLEKFLQMRCKIAAVFAGALLYIILEYLLIKYGSVFGKQTKQDAH